MIYLRAIMVAAINWYDNLSLHKAALLITTMVVSVIAVFFLILAISIEVGLAIFGFSAFCFILYLLYKIVYAELKYSQGRKG